MEQIPLDVDPHFAFPDFWETIQAIPCYALLGILLHTIAGFHLTDLLTIGIVIAIAVEFPGTIKFLLYGCIFRRAFCHLSVAKVDGVADFSALAYASWTWL